MEQRLSLITLGVKDLEKSKAFYMTGLGWALSPKSQGDLVVFQIGGMALALYPRDELSQDVNLPLGQGFGGITLAYNARSETEVDHVMNLAGQAGATILKPAQATFWGGYAGYFTDPDGYPFEIAYNPFWPLDAAGNLEISG